MIPAVLAAQMQQGLADYLRTTFPLSNPFFRDRQGRTPLDRLLLEPGGVFKGPYVSLAMPFVTEKDAPEPFPELPMGRPPYRHQSEAFARLRHPEPKPTLIATGTGSGKTECFLLPILDHCRRVRGRPGIKAIFLYPMNALGSDQANRLAALIHKHLPGQVTAGLYVGGLDEADKPKTAMGPDHLITDRNALRGNPPDILLTNYKMLDYLLVRPEDSVLWAQNQPETLRYLVVDELHSFDGAQGTDLACLLRRLQARLATPDDWLCAVGTSATLGGGDSALAEYARKVFGRRFGAGAVIGERRLSTGDFLQAFTIAFDFPGRQDLDQLDPANHDGPDSWLQAAWRLWFEPGNNQPPDPDDPAIRIELGKRLMGHYFFQNLVRTLGREKVLHLDQLAVKLSTDRHLAALKPGDRVTVVSSMLGLIAHARDEQGRPFLHLRYQLWLRELRRMVARVAPAPSLAFSDDLTGEQLAGYLPLVHCRECGAMGWTALKRSHEHSLMKDLQELYQGFFRQDPKLVFLFPRAPGDRPPPGGDMMLRGLCGSCLTLGSVDKPACDKCGAPNPITVYAPDQRRKQRLKSGNTRTVTEKHCPYCRAHGGMTLVGVRAAGLISTLITQAFGSPYNPEPKLLAFSDSVQDAAHRAGFFAGRTWQFNLRFAAIQFLDQAEPAITLDRFVREFSRFWRRRKGDTWFISSFIAPDMLWLRDFETLVNTGELPEDSELPDMVEKRLAVALVHQMSLSARIGRSLEKSRCAVLRVAGDRLEALLPELRELLANRCAGLRDLDRDVLRAWLHGLVTHLKNQGGIMLPLLNFYLEERGKTFRFNKIPWAPNFGPNFRRPIFLTEDSRADFEQVGASGRHQSWSRTWMEKVLFGRELYGQDEAEKALVTTLEVLQRADILSQFEKGGARTWGLNPAALEISTKVHGLACDHCRHGLEVAETDLKPWRGLACRRPTCPGSYRPEGNEPDYYGRLYRRGRVNRVFSREHTGLLKRVEREALEDRFRAEGAERKPYDPNLISCTPTLELGIDIGNLDTLALCSVPPGQAAYLQRIGRAGRRDGNALTATMATARPHDLYFYAEPMEMMAGNVATPGIFLDAAAVLERQLAAFCLDRWVAAGRAEIPYQVKNIFTRLDKPDSKLFPHDFLAFTDLHAGALLEDFIALFNKNSETVSEAGCRALHRFMFGDSESRGSLRYRIIQTFWRRKEERDDLRKRLRRLNDRVKELRAGKAIDEASENELQETGREAAGLRGLVRLLENRHTLNLLTDDGFLPNYAFPESGVTLRSVIYRKKSKPSADGKLFDQWVYEYERPASGALAELAPDNRFYAGGRRVTIDRVDLKASELESWRFCNSCSYSELSDRRRKTCPACNSPQWADSGQLRPMVRLRTVYARTSDRESRISDDRDDRDNLFYRKKMLVSFKAGDRTAAWAGADEQQPFGFEFLKRCAFREINFGPAGDLGEQVEIAGERYARKGFRLCARCGKVQQENQPARHAVDCPTRTRGQDKKASVLECVYLYREFSSEAVRFLLPVTSFSWSDDKLHSFIAGLQLGLQKHFSGAIDHLRVTEHQEPAGGPGYRKRFLVLYDSVPGGTGYLKQLMSDPDQLFAVFEKALAHLKACACQQDENKDGCYRCLFAYRTSYTMRRTSRREAVAMFSRLLEGRESLKTIDSLSCVDVNPLFDSELELRFIEALRRLNKPDAPLRLLPEIVNGKPGYFLKAGNRAWQIEPQVALGSKDGVMRPVKPDFVFRPVGDQHRIKPIAVFLDGLQYHGDRIGKDLAQRAAILDSGNYHVWSLAWDDVAWVFDGKKDFFLDFLAAEDAPNTNFNAFRNGLDLDLVPGLDGAGSFQWLVSFLCDPDPDCRRRTAWLFAFLYFEQRTLKRRWRQALDRAAGWNTDELELATADTWYCGRAAFSAAGLEIFALFGAAAVGARDPDGIALAVRLEDDETARKKPGFKLAWIGFLRLGNLFQFLPNRAFISGEAQRAGLGPGLEAWAALTGGAPAIPSAWDLLKQDYEDAAELAFLEILAGAGLPVPEAGYELTDTHDAVIGQAELAWEERKLAVLFAGDDIAAFEQAGWRVVACSFQNEDGKARGRQFLKQWEQST